MAASSITAINPTSVTQGSGDPFVASGLNKADVWEHTQECGFYYKFTSRTDPDGSWLPGSITTSGLELTMFGAVSETLYPMAASGEASAVSGLAARQLQQVSYSATVGSGGMGTEGMVYTTSAGMYRRLAVATDGEYHSSWNVGSVWFPTGNNTGFQTDATFAQSMVRNILAFVQRGGLSYSPDGTVRGVTYTTPQKAFDPSLLA
jgi:hypothetical protein